MTFCPLAKSTTSQVKVAWFFWILLMVKGAILSFRVTVTSCRTEKRLHKLGINSIKELANVDPTTLKKEFGKVGL